MLTRIERWASALDAFLRANRRRRFSYGSWDCCLFACDAILAMTGTDIGAAYRNAYRSRHGARCAIAEATGGVSVLDAAESVTAAFGMPSVAVPEARRGDLAVIPRPRGFSAGIVTGPGIAVLTRIGISELPIGRACRAWRV